MALEQTITNMPQNRSHHSSANALINTIFSKLDIPSSLKSGLLTPVLKKDKDPTTQGNYRGITVTRSFSKILECIIKSRIDPILNQTQNSLQRGFTEKVSSLNAALIVSEAHHYADTKGWPFYLATLDAEKAFDTVHHEILFNKIFHDGINGDMWILLRNVYRDMSVKVKWKGTTSNPISLTQCIRQGAKLSTTLYKRYINTILDSIARSHMGATIGTLLVSSPTCADDIALIANTRAELQGMLDLVQYNTNRDLVKINATKSEIVTSAKTKDKDSFIFNGQNIEQTSSTKHLGITRTKFCKVNIEDRLQSGRRTIYAMLGPGLKSMVGLVALKIRKTYALPRCIYGMETQTYSKSDMERDWSAIKGKYVGSCINYLNDVHLQQYLYALLGVEPIETAIDRNMLYSSWALPDNQTLLNSRFYSVSYIWLIHMTRTLFVVSEKI